MSTQRKAAGQMIAIKIVYENSQKYHQKADLYN
jgi:hypothetical protein